MAACDDQLLDDSRVEKFVIDKESVISSCKSHQFVSVKSSADETNLLLEFVSGEKKVLYTIHFTPDYPNNTIVTSSEDPTAIKCYKESLMKIFTGLCNEWCKDHEIPLTENLAGSNLSELLTTQISEVPSVESSDITEGSDNNDDDDDYFDNYDDNFDAEEEDIVNPLMYKDMERVEEKYGKGSIETKVHAGINELDLLLYIDMSFLDIHTASAWGVNTEIPVVLHVHFQSASEYLDGPEPKLEVYQAYPQSKERTKFGLGTQIQKVVETFIMNQWKTTSNYHLEQEYENVVKPVITPTNTQVSKSPGHSQHVQTLLDMGFDLTAVEQALDLCQQNIERAIHLLTTGELLEESEIDESCKNEEATCPKPPVRQDSQGAKAQLIVASLENVKRPPSLENGFLSQIMMYTLNRIPSLNEFCVICDERHVLETGLLKPCVCTRELCVFAFQTLGVMSDAAESVATDADVVDLMIAMCNAATRSSRASLILDPYPSIVDPQNSQRLAMDPANKNFELVLAVLKAIITGREELLRGRCSYQSLKSVLDGYHILAFPLMQWIVATNRAYIVMIPEDRQLKSMGTKYQFLLISSPPAKELAFQQAKQKHGSTFAFHGSNIENWHSIMRRGLLNASGTKYQLHGAAYGKGIYLSPNACTSFGYSNRHYDITTTNSAQGDTLAGKKDLICIALCEVVTSKELQKSGDIWVCPNPDHVVTRFFFVYDQHSYNQASSIYTQEKNFKREITLAIELANKLKNN